MKEIAYTTPNGYTVSFCEKFPFRFIEITDTFSGNFISSKAPFQDGQTTQAVNLSVGTINFIGGIMAFGSNKKSAVDLLEEYIDLMNYVFNPKIEGTLIYNNGVVSKQIKCRPIAKPTFLDKYKNYVKIDVEFISDNPRWESATEYITGVGFTYKNLRFPLTLPSSTGFIFNEMKVNNIIKYNIYPVIEIFSTTSLIKIENENTGKKVEINRSIEENQKMVIDMSRKKAEIYEKNNNGVYEFKYNVTNWLTLDSEWIELIPGENIISVNKTITENSPISIIKYRIPYMGVS